MNAFLKHFFAGKTFCKLPRELTRILIISTLKYPRFDRLASEDWDSLFRRALLCISVPLSVAMICVMINEPSVIFNLFRKPATGLLLPVTAAPFAVFIYANFVPFSNSSTSTSCSDLYMPSKISVTFSLAPITVGTPESRRKGYKN